MVWTNFWSHFVHALWLLVTNGFRDLFWPTFFLVAWIVRRVQIWRYHRRSENSRKWPAVTAKVEVVSAVPKFETNQKAYYSGVLTYFYHHPELETGEFERPFMNQSEAREWAEGYKGRSVLIHVNPRDASESYLLQSELPEVITAPRGMSFAMSQPKMNRQVSTMQRLANDLSLMLSWIGLGLCFLMLYVHFAGFHTEWRYWLMGICIGCGVLAVAFSFYVDLKLMDDDEGKGETGAQKFQSPIWIRASMYVAGFLSANVYVLLAVKDDLPEFIRARMMSQTTTFFSLFGIWGFLFLIALLTARQRSFWNAELYLDENAL
jgi:hypothetical protein